MPRGEREAGDPLIGHTFASHYFVQQRAAGSGKRRIYKALDQTLDVPVAIEILDRSLLADPAVDERHRREVSAAARLRHPCAARITDFGRAADGTPYLATELVAARSLARVLAEGPPLSEQRVARIAAQVLEVLAEAHEAGIAHGDLGPESVLVAEGEDDAVKVLDLGLAALRRGGEDADPASDLQAVGVLLHEMLARRLPFGARTRREALCRLREETPAPPSAACPERGVSPDLDALVLRAIAPRREERPRSAGAMRDDLLACVLAPEPAEASTPPRPQTTMVLPRAAPPRELEPASGRPRHAAREEAPPGDALPPSTAAPPRPSTPPPRVVAFPARKASAGAVRDDVAPPRAEPAQRQVPQPPRQHPSPPPAPLRHEMDEPEESGETSPPPPPPRPSRRRLAVVAAAVAALALAALAAVLAL